MYTIYTYTNIVYKHIHTYIYIYTYIYIHSYIPLGGPVEPAAMSGSENPAAPPDGLRLALLLLLLFVLVFLVVVVVVVVVVVL